MGRVCYHTCQGACNRNGIDEPVGINAVERFLGDYALEKDWQLPVPAADTGKRILIVGRGLRAFLPRISCVALVMLCM